MRRRLVRKFGSLIGLLAILMISLAPAVSQALALDLQPGSQPRSQPDIFLSAFCSATSQASQIRGDKPLSPQHSAAGHWDACGYCNLAAHSPAATACASAYQARVLSDSVADNTPTQPFPPYAPVDAAQPRAPPVLV